MSFAQPASTSLTDNAGQIAIDSLQNSEIQQFLTFTVGEDEFGIDIMAVREVKGWAETTRLPNTPRFMRGVLNLRGVVIPIFDLQMRLFGSATEATSKHVIVIMAVGERIAGILVDAVSDIISVTQPEIKSAPDDCSGIDERFVSGLIAVEQRMVVLLEMQKLLKGEELDAISVTNKSEVREGN